MRTLAITQNVTVDGSIEMLDGWFDPQGQAGVDSCTADGLLLGRQTFDDMRGYWPQQSQDATGVTAYLNLVQKYLVSSTMTDPEWQNSIMLSGDPVQEVHALKEQPARTSWSPEASPCATP